ncbi:helix-turn-helix domain-containing protein [Rhizobium sp. 2MFCol3.1]|uniref:helix-turn-helix domain-containing protein n=1 Tax=Rhizobium sp. 2MFCol3.1 TaxID=1246459 RepID=UPI000379AE7F|nr:helix-turn-helix domain-containing protein [Rhizobium sp. 2MFCol3.1]
MIVTAREFTSAAEMRAAAVATHSRCFNPVVKVAPKIEAAPKPAPVIRFFAKQLPMWESGMLTFDAHVIAFRTWNAVSTFSTSGKVCLSGDLDAAGRRTIEAIVSEVLARYPGTTIADVRSGRRPRSITEPRQVAMYEVYSQRPDLSLPMIGRWFRKDHTTILHAIRKVGKLRGAA